MKPSFKGQGSPDYMNSLSPLELLTLYHKHNTIYNVHKEIVPVSTSQTPQNGP